MPIFGSFETIGSAHAETQTRHHLRTVWRARKAGAPADRIYAIKVFTPTSHSPAASHRDSTLEKDPGLEFLRSVKQHKKAAEVSRDQLIPIHEFGAAPEGAWYATDFYRRGSLEVWVTLRGKVDSAALRNVVGSAVQVCKALKETRGRSHGNLKASNVFLGGKSQPLGQTPLLFAEPLVVSELNIARLEGSDQQSVRGLIKETLEAHDLRGIGELIWQLVMGRLIRSGTDYNYPVGFSKEWQRLGRDGEKWCKLCSDLVNPSLSLEVSNLDALARQFRPASGSALPWLTISLVAGVCVLGGAGYYFRGAGAARHPQPTVVNSLSPDQAYQAAMAAGQSACLSQKYDEALREAGVALKIKPGDAAATKLENDAAAGQNASLLAAETHHRFDAAMTAGRQAYEAGAYDAALTNALAALGLKPEDSQAAELKTDARAKLAEAAAAAQNQRDFEAALAAGQAALAAGNYQVAQQDAQHALALKPGNELATGLNLAAQAGQAQALASARAAKAAQDFTNAMSAGRSAFQAGNYELASQQAATALTIKPGDADATDLQAGVRKAVQFGKAMTAGRQAYAAGAYDAALTNALAALGLKPEDSQAAELKTKARAKLAEAAAAAQNQREFEAALAAGQAALAAGNYQVAQQDAQHALALKPGNELATGLNHAAQAGQAQALAVAQAAKDAQDFTNAMSAGRSALQAGNYELASQQAATALQIKAGNTDAQALLANAQAEIQFKAALVAGQSALQTNNYAAATAEAQQALRLKPQDVSASDLAKQAQAGLKNQETLAGWDRQLEDLMKLLGVKRDSRYVGSTIDPAHSKQQELGGADTQTVLSLQPQAEGLITRYKTAKAYSTERAAYLDGVIKNINNWGN